MDILRIAAFSDGDEGGNPAGVHIGDRLPDPVLMQSAAAEVGFSETAFATPVGEKWRVRYFSPESEVPFCGHATIALGAALALRNGDGTFTLSLNEAEITVEGSQRDGKIAAALQSPPTWSRPAEPRLISQALDLFGYSEKALDPRIPPAFTNGGANHLVLALESRTSLATMFYDLGAGRDLMNSAGLVTINLVQVANARKFNVRNAFASGGVLEDPATGAAAAALAGYLRDLNWPHENSVDIVQGEDMGMKSLIKAEFAAAPGSSVRVSGTARIMGHN